MEGQGPTFRNREEAGQLLAEELNPFVQAEDVLVLGLPRGGVPVAFEVARALEASLDVLLVRKLGVPGQEELALGAISSNGVRVLNEHVVHNLGIGSDVIEAVCARETEELKRREVIYRGTRTAPRVKGRIVIIVDDGIATGATMRAAIQLLRMQGAGRIVVAVPTAPPDAVRELRTEADDVVAVLTPEPFFGVGRWYQDFSQTTDQEVGELLETNEMDSTGIPRIFPSG